MRRFILLCCLFHFLLQAVLSAQPVVFKHTVTSQNLTANYTTLSHPATDQRPNALLFVTTDYGRGQYPAAPIGVWYNSGKWTIFNQDRSPMTRGAQFNVLVLEPSERAFVHQATAKNTSGHITYLDHPLLNGNPKARLLVTQNWQGVYNNSPIGVYYTGQQWAIFNQDLRSMPTGALFNVFVSDELLEIEARAPLDNWCAARHPSLDNQSNLLLFVTQYWTSVYNPSEVGVWYDDDEWRIFNQSQAPMPKGARFFVYATSPSPVTAVPPSLPLGPQDPRERLKDPMRDPDPRQRPQPQPQPTLPRSPFPRLTPSDIKRNEPTTAQLRESLERQLRGWVDLHTHPMSHLGFGRKAMHGAPDVGIYVPPGMASCDWHGNATSPAQALANCNPTHGGWGRFDNLCGNYFRAGVISGALDKDFIHNTRNELHPDHHHDGYPNFPYWPHHSSKLHQQMWWEWIKRAYDGGLRVMVALTVNSELLAALLDGDRPYDDESVAVRQIAETKRFVEQHSDFMEIAYSAEQLRDIVRRGKLAVVLGMEMDRWSLSYAIDRPPAANVVVSVGGSSQPPTKYIPAPVQKQWRHEYRPDLRAYVRNLVQRWYNMGIRYVFPVHLVDNEFSGAAVYDVLFSFANCYTNGYHFLLESSSDRNLGYDMRRQISGFRDAIGRLRDAPGRPRFVDGLLNTSAELERKAEHFSTGRHVNTLGLTYLGEIALQEMMSLGMLIDIDHMSEKAQRRAVEIAESIPGGGYPLFMGHNGIRSIGGNERNAPRELVERISRLGGMLGVGTAHATPEQFVRNFQSAWEAMGGRAVAVGTDVNGFELLPHHRRPNTSSESDRFYRDFFSFPYFEGRITDKSGIQGSSRKWDYITEGGVSHYGLMPEFFYDVSLQSGGREVVDNLWQAAEYFAQAWEKCERVKSSVASASIPPSRDVAVATYAPVITHPLCPRHTGGDREFAGRGPRASGSIELRISPDKTQLQAVVTLQVQEWDEPSGRPGDTRGEGSWIIELASAPPGMYFDYITVPYTTTMRFDRVLRGGGRTEFLGAGEPDGEEHSLDFRDGFVERIKIIGDTGGEDVSHDDDCSNDTRITEIRFRPISVRLIPIGVSYSSGRR
ncbi:MAG: membrane dipeptidase [Chloroherpetonaceae bacterium]|nr:membrane dipeptidase [Chloroherpetonaceae bacterium]